MYKLIIKNIILSIIFSIAVIGCKHNNHDKIYTVSEEKISHTLTYKGTIAPLEIINITSPNEGVIQNVNFFPGQMLEKNQRLLTLYSPKYRADYQNNMLAYLKAKEDYTNQQSTFLGTQELQKNGLISRNDFNLQKSALANSYALLLQQQQAISKFLLPGQKLDTSLNLENKEQLHQLFDDNKNDVTIFAPKQGIALSPAKINNNSNNDNAAALRISSGDLVHQGDSLLTIGDLSGFNIIFTVSEMDVNSIEKNMPAKISSDAFSETLTGSVAEIGFQAKSSNSDAVLPEFPARVIVPHITPNDLKNIRIGMTVKVTIELGNHHVMLIPLTAVGNDKDKSLVKKIMPNGQIKIVAITPGDTTLDQVAVLSGLKSGDHILATY
jgi:HlyD family secretion protein